MSRRASVGLLLAALLALVAVAAVAERAAGGEHLRGAILGCGLAAVPGVLTLLGDSPLARRVGPVVAYGLAVGLRGIAAFGGGLLIASGLGSRPVFWAWFLAAYLVGLVVETVVLTRKGRSG